MLRITLDFHEATWGDLRKYVALNHAAGDDERLAFETSEFMDDAIIGLSEVVPSKEVLPRGE